MNIKVVQYGYPVHLNEDNEWRCLHQDVIIERPCCSSAGSSGYVECGCGGMMSVYCNDCDNDDLRDYEINEIMELYL